MKRFRLLLLTVLFTGLLVAAAGAAEIALFDWGFNVDGSIYLAGDALPGYFNTAGFDFGTGLGTIDITFDPNAAGVYSVLSFFDHEIDEGANTFFNEYGATSGTPGPGLSWEIDEPGYVYGNIFTNFVAGGLDNSNGVPQSTPDDVSMALGWNMILGADEFAAINLIVTDIAPTSGFYLAQVDPDSQAAIYLQGTINIQGGGTQVPEPSTLLLLAPALGGLYLVRRRMKG